VTLTGREIDLSSLTAAERSLLGEVLERFRARPDWTVFSAFWTRAGRRKLWATTDPVGSAAYRICQDLEARLGIAQGKVSPPDYRDLLLDLIDSQFPSRAAFCRSAGLDPGHLSRVLGGKSELSVQALYRALDAVGRMIASVPSPEIHDPVDRLQRLLDGDADVNARDLLRAIDERRGVLRTLHVLAKGTPIRERSRLVETALFEEDEQLRGLAAEIKAEPTRALEAIEAHLEQLDEERTALARATLRARAALEAHREDGKRRAASA
jgi:hypothetical protein